MSGLKFPQCATMTFIAMLVLAGCVTQQKYDALEARYRQLNQTMSTEIAANQMQITRLQNAIKVTVNDELLFPSGDWDMPAEAQQTLGKIIPILAPMQQTKMSVTVLSRVMRHALIAPWACISTCERRGGLAPRRYGIASRYGDHCRGSS